MAISISVKFKKAYSLDELLSSIKDFPFTAGQPTITKHGPARLITFPALDSHNQVQIIKGSLFGKASRKYIVQKAEAAGLDNMIKNEFLDMLTNEWANKRSIIGGTAELSSALVDATAQELEGLGL